MESYKLLETIESRDSTMGLIFHINKEYKPIKNNHSILKQVQYK